MGKDLYDLRGKLQPSGTESLNLRRLVGSSMQLYLNIEDIIMEKRYLLYSFYIIDVLLHNIIFIIFNL
jgi:hypothetical protein